MCKEKDYLLREYEMFRYLMFKEEPTDKICYKMTESVLNDEEYLRFVITTTIDSFGDVQLNGTISPAIIIANFEDVNPEITETLLNNLLFEYQDEAKTIPLIITGSNFGKSYLEAVLSNTNIKLKASYNEQLTKALIKSLEIKMNYDLLTLFLLRDDIEKKSKKEVIDYVDEENLYLLKELWEDMFLGFDFLDAEAEMEDKLSVFEETEEESNNTLASIIQLIDEKLYSE